ncbi:MAG: hypothetical protein GY810_32045 [Aureispira sp.]|nr:hypothetical protein [Aureispira sp.]
MAISKKGKRSITVNSKSYLWWVYRHYDNQNFIFIAQIVAKDQSFSIHYSLDQNLYRQVNIGLRHDAGWISLACPQFENKDRIITSKGIRQLIEWCSLAPSETNIRSILGNWTKDELKKKQQLYQIFLEKLNP